MAVLSVTFLLFLPATNYDFIGYDDADYVSGNVHMRDGLTAENVKWAFMSRGYADNWHPLAWLSMMADVSMLRAARHGAGFSDEEWNDYGNRLSRVMHFHNIALHAVNAALLFFLMLVVHRARSSAPDSPSQLALVWYAGLALLWAVHPLRTEVVCWVAERKEILSVFWMLLALIFYFGESVLVAFVCAALAMMAKPVAVSLPAVLVAWDWIFRGRPRWLRTIPFFVLSAATCVFTMQSQTEAIENGGTVDFAGRVYCVFVAPLIYIRQTFWPFDLSCIYGGNYGWNVPAVAGGILLFVLIVAVCVIWLLKRKRNAVLDILAFSVAWVYIGLLPMLGIVKVGGQEHSDRYTYWIGCGAVVVVGMLAEYLLPGVRRAVYRYSPGREAEEWGTLRKSCLIVVGVLVVACCWITRDRMPFWRNTTVLFRDAIPKCWCSDIVIILDNCLKKQGIDGEEEISMWYRACLDHAPCIAAGLDFADYMLRRPDPSYSSFGNSKPYVEAGLLIDDVLRNEPNNKRAKELKQKLEKIRSKVAKRVQGK